MPVAIEFAADRAIVRSPLMDPGPVRSVAQARLAGGAWMLLALAEVVTRASGFSGVYRAVRRWPTRGQAPVDAYPAILTEASEALVRARTLYVKRTRCLQRGVALTCLLRRRGVPAHLVIGVQRMPFFAHAWVEVNGQVVSDGGASVAMYREMTRC